MRLLALKYQLLLGLTIGALLMPWSDLRAQLAPSAPSASSARAAAPTAPLELVRSAQYELQYRIPAGWDQLREATDTTVTLTHVSPDKSMMFFLGKLRGAAAGMTPAQALYHLTEKFGVPVNKQFATRYNGIQFLETTGMGNLDGRPLRYDALAANHRGHVLLVYFLATPDAFMNHEPLVQDILHSLTTYKPRRESGK